MANIFKSFISLFNMSTQVEVIYSENINNIRQHLKKN